MTGVKKFFHALKGTDRDCMTELRSDMEWICAE